MWVHSSYLVRSLSWGDITAQTSWSASQYMPVQTSIVAYRRFPNTIWSKNVQNYTKFPRQRRPLASTRMANTHHV